MSHHHDQPIPRGVLIAAAALIVCAIALAALARQGLIARSDLTATQTVEYRDLIFTDRHDGGIDVQEAINGEAVAIIASGTNGFLRGVLRGLVRERRQYGFAAEQPFRLLRQSDGRLTLLDLATQRRIELVSFGPTNAKAFARFLPMEEENS